jgi:hypothetical protein
MQHQLELSFMQQKLELSVTYKNQKNAKFELTNIQFLSIDKDAEDFSFLFFEFDNTGIIMIFFFKKKKTCLCGHGLIY